MAKQDNKKVATKNVAKDPKKVSQSTELVNFKASKNHNGIKKDKVYPLSRNVAEILEMQGLGKQV